MNLRMLFFAIVAYGPFFWVLLSRDSFRKAFFVKYLPSSDTPMLIIATIVWSFAMVILLGGVAGALNGQARAKKQNAVPPRQ